MKHKTISTPRGELTLRTVTANDAQAVRDLRLQGLIECPGIFGTAPVEIDGIDWNDFTAKATGTGDQAIFVIEREGQLVAMTGCIHPTRIKDRHAALIWGVYIIPEFRGLRLVGQLITAAYEWARTKGVTIVRLTVVTTNKNAIAAYKRCGFEITGTDIAAIAWEGVEYDEYLMVRRA